MKKLYSALVTSMLLAITQHTFAQYEWSNISVPANGSWDLVESLSDDFSYNASFGSGGHANRSNFGPGNKWYNFYHNAWDGPGYTYWNTSNVSVDGDNLVITAGYTSRNSKGGSYGVASGCVTSNAKVTYPVYVESSVSVANISLASCFWLLSPDDTEEIDIIENYGGVNWFKNFTHISHHSFVRTPFTDYQPKDWNSWYPIDEITTAGGWGEYCWNGGNRRYMRMGVNWIGPKHWEYYIDGSLVRVMYYNAMATKINGTWQYTYYNAVATNANGYYFPTNGNDGYSAVTLHTTSNNYNFNTLQAASNASNGYSVIDPGWFQGGDTNDTDGNGVTNEARGFTKAMDIIINIESQSWLLNSTPSQSDLNAPSKNKMLVDWVRVYKPSNSGGGNNGNTGGSTVITCDNAPQYNGNANSYAAGDRVLNGGVLYERTANGWNLIEDCNDSNGNTGGNNNSNNSGVAIPGTIQAENYSNMNGVQTENTSDSGGGQNVGWINSGDWMDYAVSVSSAGTYTVNFRVAAKSNNIRLDLKSGNNVLTSVNSNATGGWQNWKTVSATVNLSEGSQTLRIQATGGGWNINWIQFVSAGNSNSGNNGSTGTTCANAPAYNGNANSYSAGDRVINGGVLYEKRANGGWNLIETCSSSKSLESISEIEPKIYPNPVRSGDIVTVSGVFGELIVANVSGKIVATSTATDGETSIDTSNLKSGVYFVKTATSTLKLIVK